MEHLQLAQDRVKDFYKSNPRAVQIGAGLFGLYVLKKAANVYWYRQKLFSKESDVANKVVLITGCDTGIGHGTALKLSIVCGYKVIATCLKQEAVEKFLSNSEFTKNGSTATVMDVTKQDDIQRAKQFTINYLEEHKCILWGLVNNAGMAISGELEVVPKEFDEMVRSVVLTGPINIIRQFLPLMHGRKNYEAIQSSKTASNGGRIVNVTSLAAYLCFPGQTRYGTCKTALSYFSHTLRMELSPRFGIWVNEVAPGGFNTPILQNAASWTKRVEDKLKENKQSELLRIYDSLTADEVDRMMTDALKDTRAISTSVEPAADCIIHGLTARYPERTYRPNWRFPIGWFATLPFWIAEPLFYRAAEAARQKLRAK